MNWPTLSMLWNICEVEYLLTNICQIYHNMWSSIPDIDSLFFRQLAKRCINCTRLFKELAICFTDFLFSLSLISIYIYDFYILFSFLLLVFTFFFISNFLRWQLRFKCLVP